MTLHVLPLFGICLIALLGGAAKDESDTLRTRTSICEVSANAAAFDGKMVSGEP